MASTIDQITIIPETESALVGTVLLRPEVWPDVEAVKVHDFHTNSLRVVWQVLERTGGKATPERIVTQLRGTGVEDAADFVRGLVLRGRSSDQAQELGAMVLEAAAKRGIYATLSSGQRLFDPRLGLGSGEIVDRVIGELEQIRVGGVVEDGDVGEAIQELAREYAWHLDNPGQMRGLRTGFRDVDDLVIGGIDRGNFVVIASSSGEGKSLFAGQVAVNVIERPQDDGRCRRIGMAGTEMATHEMLGRFVVAHSGLPADLIRSGRLDKPQRTQLQMAMDWLQEVIRPSFFYLGPDRFKSIGDLVHKAKYMIREHGLDAFVVDYIQAVNAPGDEEWERIGVVTRELKGLAADMRIPVLGVSQISRENIKNASGRPSLWGMAGSSAVEKYADMVIGLYRPERHLERDAIDKMWKGKAILEMLKGRFRQTSQCYLEFDGARNRFQDLDPKVARALGEPLAQEALKPKRTEVSSRKNGGTK